MHLTLHESATFYVVENLGVVVPTLGLRGDYLTECLDSITAIEGVAICVVAPTDVLQNLSLPPGTMGVVDPMNGVSAAINVGLKFLVRDRGVAWVTWLGDDDLFSRGAPRALAKFRPHLNDVAVIGRCNYFNNNGDELFVSKPGRLAVAMLELGPNLIPQPGSFYKASVLEQLNYLDESLKYAFDQDLFHKLKKVGRIRSTGEVLAWYRWHPDSLSFSGRIASEDESHALRLKYVPKLLKFLPKMWKKFHALYSKFFSPMLPS